VASPPKRLVTAERREEDAAEMKLRPQRLSEFIGQQQARANLSVFIEAARARNEALDHVLLVGPPGLGKTTLAQIVSRELGVNFRATSGPVIAKAGDLAALLTNLEERDVLFIDEIHRLNPAVEEVLYPAMEDFQLDLIIGEGPAARSVKIDLAKFTLVGATTRAGLLTNPLRDRFGIPVRLNFYTEQELELIVNRGARVLGLGMTADGANEIARRSRGTPRIAGRLLRRVRDFAYVGKVDKVDRKLANKALLELEVDAAGLDAMDRRYLITIAEHYGGGPVGVETLAAALSEPRDAIEEIIEPFLIQKGVSSPDRPSSTSDWPSLRAIRHSSACLPRMTRAEGFPASEPPATAPRLMTNVHPVPPVRARRGFRHVIHRASDGARHHAGARTRHAGGNQEDV
jgi:Holliday junction DNA helicase RuvB